MAHSQRATTPFATDAADELPLSVQLAWRLRALIASGRLRPGDRMPSVRALADWSGVNVNTVRGVYAKLEDDGVIATRHGSGSFVAAGADGSAEAERVASEAIDAARAAGLDPRDVAMIITVAAALPELPELEPAPVEEPDLAALAAELELEEAWRAGDESAARHELRRQVARIEAELASYPGEAERAAPRLAGRAEPRIAAVAELERTRDELLARLAAARAAAARRAEAESRAREVRDAIVADPAGHRWEAVSAADTGDPGCETWSVAPRMGPLGALMGWWRVKVSGGCPLAVPLAAAIGRADDRRGREPDAAAGAQHLRAGREHDDPDRQDAGRGGQAAAHLRHRVHRAVRVRSPALLVSDGRLDGRGQLRRPGASGRELPQPAWIARPARWLLHPRERARVRAARQRAHRRRRRRDGDHSGPGCEEDPRGARRAPGPRRRPDQEPRGTALPRSDADHRAARHLRDPVRDLGRADRRGRLRPAAERVLRNALQQRVGDRAVGIAAQVHVLR